MRTALITGCSSGIGRATAERFHRNGWTVYATARDTDDIADLTERGMETVELDVTEDDDVENAVGRVVDENRGIGCVVNNAGYGEAAAVEDLTVEELHAQFEVNTYGPHRLARAALPYMREQHEGTVVNMSSVGGRLSQPGLGGYCASKFALEALSDALRSEVRGFGVDVVLVEPGPVRTPFGDKAEEKVKERPDDSPYADLYERVGEFNQGVSDEGGDDIATHLMGKITVPPQRVAETVVEAVEDDDPKARYKISVPHRMMAMGRYLPSEVRDRIYDTMI
ncbi:MAG: NAD(P)-dependent dehydrogenase (short-subunit alcohol dehydrogenase family) [Methanobacteriota archaeon]|jgi:NAD(P)-dependent dehydrogenase (short-subunit alcohol dehydrogenase family)|uniref:SDR family oxidoreductase n=1 Tax=Halorutilus salinus TaxID=2487751 RepID=A0A9Q4C607_9EURY|nr:SDR family oxidoreductase [Halorutilus salinus]MCX2819039.1 SDR family oxidoreductase [Halorutilus salinus]